MDYEEYRKKMTELEMKKMLTKNDERKKEYDKLIQDVKKAYSKSLINQQLDNKSKRI